MGWRWSSTAGALLGFILVACVGCTSTPTIREASERIARQLHDGVARRADPSSIRVQVREVQPEGESMPSGRWPHRIAGRSRWSYAEGLRDVASELARGLTAAMAKRFQVVGTGRDRGEADAGYGKVTSYAEAERRMLRMERRRRRPRKREANAVLLGEYHFTAPDILVVAVRLVDLKTRLILATAGSEASLSGSE